MASTVNFSNHVKRFSDTMRGTQRVLYVGTDYDIGKYPALVGKEWKCIYTTNAATNFADVFSKKDRQVRPIFTKADYDAASTKLDHHNPLLIYLNGATDDEETAGDLDFILEKKANSRALRNTLSSLLRSELLVELVVVGYNPKNPDEINTEDFVELVRTLSDNRITFYGMSEAQEKDLFITYLVKKGIATVFSQNLGEALNEMADISEDALSEYSLPVPDTSDALKYTVYVNGKNVVLNQTSFYDFSKYGRVLSVREMATGTISRMMQVDFFYQFLKKSPHEPQWYGYAERNSFAATRDFENELYDCVKKSLENSSETPVILAGQSGSGKSIALARLAYRVYQEKKYPVLYINNSTNKYAKNSQESRALENILQELKDNGGRVLVILDWSIYNIQRNDIVRTLSDRYNNHGQRVLFVASAMYPEPEMQGYRFINAPIELGAEEKKKFKDLLVEKGKAPRHKIERWFREHDDIDGLLSILYRLVYDIHPELEAGIKTEIKKALEDTRADIDVEEEKHGIRLAKKHLSSLAEQLSKHKYAKPLVAVDGKELKENMKNSLQPFSECLAVASLFKLRMPITMAMHLLNIPECEERQKYRDLIFSAPWIHCAMDDDKYAPGEYYVTFRDPVDARIYLNGINKHAADQMQIVAQAILTLKEERDTFFNEEVRFLEQLIRMMGPNSDDQQVKENWYYTYGAGCKAVIDALAELRAKNIIEPQLVAQEITYIREYCGSSNQTDLLKRVKSLGDAIQIARDVLDMTERPNVDTAHWQQGLIDSITVENIYAELYLERCYLQAKNENIEINREKEGLPILFSYTQRSRKLLEIIEAQPENPFAYTALLSCFVAEYKNNLGDTEMFSRMAEVLEVIDITAANIPRIEMNDHYQTKKAEFYRLFDQVSGSTRAEHYFDELLEMGSAVGIYIKASSILRKAGIKLNEVLSAEKLAACKKALGILEDKKYSSIVSYHAASQYMRLQLTWLYHNRHPVFERERQYTSMEDADWIRLYQICSEFKSNIIERQADCPYVTTVYYIMALSLAQMGHYEQAVSLWHDVDKDDYHAIGWLYTWHILSTPEGKPKMFTGTFNSRRKLPERRIFIKEMQRTVLYPSLPSINKSDTSGDAPNLCIGTSYRGFSAFTPEWKARRD